MLRIAGGKFTQYADAKVLLLRNSFSNNLSGQSVVKFGQKQQRNPFSTNATTPLSNHTSKTSVRKRIHLFALLALAASIATEYKFDETGVKMLPIPYFDFLQSSLEEGENFPLKFYSPQSSEHQRLAKIVNRLISLKVQGLEATLNDLRSFDTSSRRGQSYSYSNRHL